MFGNIGPEELILIFIVALLVFGPKKLPEIGRSVGKAIREFKKASEEIRGRIEGEIQASEIKDVHNDIKSGLDSLQSGVKGFKDRIKQTMGLDDPARSAAAAETTSAFVTSCELAPETRPGVESPAPVPESPPTRAGNDPNATLEGEDPRRGISFEADSRPENIDKNLTAHKTGEGRYNHP